MSIPLLLALDQGTTSSRSLLVDAAGRMVASAQQEFPQHYPQPGWVEHDPFELWQSQFATMERVLEKIDPALFHLEGIGITNQRETTLVWDRQTGQPVYPAIVWQDRRTADRCRELKAKGLENAINAKTGLRLDPYFSGTKVQWILEQVPGARERAEAGELAFGTVDSWLIWQLTQGQVHATDPSNASRTLLYHVDHADWDDELLALFGIPRSMMPALHPSSGILGKVADGLPGAGTPIAGVAGDQQAALFGQTCFAPGMTKSTYGTGAFLLMHTGTTRRHSSNNLLSSVAWQIGDEVEYALEGSVFIAGAGLQWLRDELQIAQTTEEIDTLAASVPDTGGLVFVPAFAGLGAPHWDPYARGLMVGMTRGTSRAHVCRAALEAIAFQIHDLITAMERDSGLPRSELRVDGGAANSDPLLQIQADLLGTGVIRPQCVETTAMGAAFLAGLATGIWKSREELKSLWVADKRYQPGQSAKETARQLHNWQRAVERCKGWIEPEVPGAPGP